MQKYSIFDVADSLNKMLEVAPIAIGDLLEHRTPVSHAQADADRFIVTTLPGKDGYFLGLLGVLNGLVGMEWPRIAAYFEQKEDITPTRFYVMNEDGSEIPRAAALSHPVSGKIEELVEEGRLP